MTTIGVLLAAGRGVRLAPVTDRIPKPALPILDTPLGAWGLNELNGLNIPVVVNVSRHGDFVRAALEPFTSDQVEFVNELPEPFGGGGTLAGLADRAADFIVTRNADHLIKGLDLRELLAEHSRSGASATIVVRAVPERADVEIDGSRARRLIDRREQNASGGLWLGVAVISRAALSVIPQQRPIDLAEGLLDPLIERDEVAVHIHHGYELDVGTPGRYLRVCVDIMRGRAPKPPRPVRGEVLEAGGGLAFVGSDATVHETSVGADAIILAASQVPEGSYVTRAIVMPGERVPQGVRVEDAIFFDGKLIRI